MNPQALYLHIPFCARRCRYCDFATGAVAHGDPFVAAYVDALRALVERLGAHGLLADVRTAYLGGGTPTMAGEALPGLASCVRAACPGLREFSTEANPESLTGGLARRLAGAGVTRVSLGVQSLDDAELARLGRAHGACDARRAAAAAVGAGLDLSCDLMCGIPLQTPESWEASLRDVLDLGAGHVSCYPLALEEGTPLEEAVSRGDERVADDDAAADLMLAAARTLSAAGLARYEVASYALPGKECAHNIAYWTGVPYLGLGSSAAGMLDPEGFALLAQSLPFSCTPEEGPGFLGPNDSSDPASGWSTTGEELAARIVEVGEGRAARVRLRMLDDAHGLVAAVREGAPLRMGVEILSRREAAVEDLMLGMRMSRGVAPDALARAASSGVVPRAELDAALAGIEARGLARHEPDGRLVPTERGWLLGNELYGLLWDLAGG